MNDNVIDLLKNTCFFSKFDISTLQLIAPYFEFFSIQEGEFLFHQGDNPDFLYIVVQGKLITLLPSGDGTSKKIGFIHENETVGEMGVITNDKRSLSVKAVETSSLLKLSQKTINDIFLKHPEFLIEIMQSVLKRSQSVINLLSDDNNLKTMVIFSPHADNLLIKEFISSFHDFAKNVPSLLFLSDTMEVNLKKPGELKQLLQQPGKLAICCITSLASNLSTFCIENAPEWYFLVDGNAKAEFSQEINKFLISLSNYHVNLNLLLIYEKKQQPTNTKNWLDLHDFNSYFHVCINNNLDYKRLTRYLRGSSVALVLSGGGARGWAHIGVIKALIDNEIPIDFIGGTSAGALIGGYYALYGHFDRIREVFDAGLKTIKLKNMVWPKISLFNCIEWTKSMMNLFENSTIENLWLPFFCISSEVTENIEFIHNQGLLWQAIRASTSLPGLAPPMVIDGKMHFDGGLINNLPVDVMRKVTKNRAIIIACDLHSPQAKKAYNFPPMLTFKQTAFARFMRNHNLVFPSFLETFMQSLYIGASARNVIHAKDADILIKLDLIKYSIVKLLPGQDEELFKLGYQTAIEIIPKIKAQLKDLSAR